MFLLMIIQRVPGWRNFVADITLKGAIHVVGLDVARHVVPAGVAVGTDGAGRDAVPEIHVLAHKYVQVFQAGDVN